MLIWVPVDERGRPGVGFLGVFSAVQVDSAVTCRPAWLLLLLPSSATGDGFTSVAA
jgi:hypothetical protein